MKRSLAAAYIAAVFLVGPHLGYQASAAEGLMTDSVHTGLVADHLAASLMGADAVVTNAEYRGAPVGGGLFTGGEDIVGLEHGVVLSSGDVSLVRGPNVAGDTTGNAAGFPGDPDLDAVSGTPTDNAAVLEFDFVLTSSDPTVDLTFRYVFSSDEYNDTVPAGFNDAFGLWIDGVNCATVGSPGVGVSVGTINMGINPDLFRNNDLQDGGGSINTEMDGLTVVLNCAVTLSTAEKHHAKFAVGDAGDELYDANVFVGGAAWTERLETDLDAHPLAARATPAPTSALPNLQASLADEHGNPLRGRTVVFTAGGAGVCEAVTNAAGIARCSDEVATALALAAGGYEAWFTGSVLYEASRADGALIEAGDVIV